MIPRSSRKILLKTRWKLKKATKNGVIVKVVVVKEVKVVATSSNVKEKATVGVVPISEEAEAHILTRKDSSQRQAKGTRAPIIEEEVIVDEATEGEDVVVDLKTKDKDKIEVTINSTGVNVVADEVEPKIDLKRQLWGTTTTRRLRRM